jgi:hypothetical protein
MPDGDRAAALSPGRPLTLTVLPGQFAISRGAAAAAIPAITAGELLSVTRTTDELSIVASDAVVFDGFVREPGWRCLKVAGPLTFDQVGVVAALAAPLAAAGISIFVISTFDTDYLLVKDAVLNAAMAVLTEAGHPVAGQLCVGTRSTT